MEHVNVKGRFIVILGAALLSLWAWYSGGIKLGQDLRGGTNLRFALDLAHAERTRQIQSGERERVVQETIKVIEDRINTFGLAETTITSLGENKFEISLPAGSEGETEGIVKVVTDLGDLQFRIEVQPRDAAGYGRGEDGEYAPRLRSLDKNDWPWPGSEEEFRAFLEKEVKVWTEARTQALPYVPSDPKYYLVKREGASGTNPEDFRLLENTKDAEPFTGKILSDPQVGEDERGVPVVLFKVKLDYQNTFGEWTERNVKLPMAIVLNGEYRSAPRINSKLTNSVQITLGERNRTEVKKEAERLAKILQTGSLRVRPELESRNKIGAKLAGEAKDRGIQATIVAFLLVLAFMVWYYRGPGWVANLALLLNLVLMVGILAFFRATLTLPGIAGVVLTLGMAVDANILINERIREEIKLGKSLKRALSDGYERALSTIVDANVTTLITALFLYIYGSGAIKGFAVSLTIGLLVSMFTAIYVTRTVFEWGFQAGFLKEFKIAGEGKVPQVRWMALRRLFVPLSVGMILFGLGIFFLSDPMKVYDIDFTGGFKVQARFTKPTTVDDVKRALDTGVRKVTVIREEVDPETEVRKQVPVNLDAGPYEGAEVLAVGDAGDQVEINVQRLTQAGSKDLPVELQGKAFTAYARVALADRLQPDWIAGNPEIYRKTGDDDPLADFDGSPRSRVTIYDPAKVVTPAILTQLLKDEMPYVTFFEGKRRVSNPRDVGVVRQVEVRPVSGEGTSLPTFDVWIRTKDASGKVQESDPAVLRQTLGEFLGTKPFREALERAGVAKAAADQVDQSEPFPSIDIIGASVAKRMKDDALVALVLSMIGIIVYVAIRFSSRAMGFSAVLCLFHDVAVSVGITVLANSLGLVDAKINLTMVAAILTLVGYSVNDTVVIFDRIRENRGNKPTISPEMIDLSINQTFVRSIKTSVTVFLVCLALFVFNIGQRNVLEGFSFFMIVGSVIGAYSTVAIASPLLLFLPWYWERAQKYAPRLSFVTKPAASLVTVILVPFAAILWAAWWIAFGLGAFVVGLAVFPMWAVTSGVQEIKAA